MKNKKEGKFVEKFLGEIPVLGGFFKELGKTEVFQEKFKEVNEKIEANLRDGKRKDWAMEFNMSIKPILKDFKKDNETTKITIGDDYFYGQKDGRLIVAVKAPEEANFEIRDKNLFITAENFEKKLELPGYYKHVEKKNYKMGILELELK